MKEPFIISFSMLGQYGRLGNQAFQISGVMGLAEKYGAQAAFPEWSYQPYFENVLPRGEMSTNQVKERYFNHYDWDLSADSDLLGYLQSEKYFGSFRLKLKKSFVEDCKARAGLLDFFREETICIHIRRGDYVNNENYYQIKPEFYIDALITHFPHWRDCNILFISDDPEYCRVHFGCLPNAHFSKGFSDIEDMALASACDHFIISNSSFGWWCAYLGEASHSKIVHCGRLHAGRLAAKGHRDYYPARWIEHKKESYKIPLRDVTFTIPVFHDHLTRKENLDLTAYFLLSSFDTNLIIMEQGGNVFQYTAEWAKYIQAECTDFHRTRMLNDMCNQAESAYIANWDCDLILPPMQIYLAVEELRAGADMVYPYAGPFARMPRAWFAVIQKALDIGIVKDEPFKGREADHFSVGGAVMFNRESFYDGGMENENFVSFGPEDVERYERFKLLGYDIRRMGGTLFHLNHYVGPNSSPRNPHFEDNNKELEKVRGMDRQTLREYVDSWLWRHPYTSRYYHQISEGSIRSARVVMNALGFIPKSIIDIGCGVGEWGIDKTVFYVGVDHRINKNELLFSADRFIDRDLNNTFLDMEDINNTVLGLPGKFDLCLCLEVAEHLRPNRAEGLVKMLCNLSDRVLFSAAIPYQGGKGHCFRGDTIVSGPRATQSFSRYYEGEMTELTFASGGFLSVTPNHPILTPDGWVPAGFLNKGDYVIRCLDGNRITRGIPDEYQVPSLIEDIATSLGVAGGVVPVSVPLSPEDFHGDGIGSKIAIIRSNSLLRDSFNSPIFQPIRKINFTGTDISFSLLHCQGMFTQCLERPSNSFDSFDKCIHNPFPTLGTPFFGRDLIHFGSSSKFNTVFDQDISYGLMASATEDYSDFFGRFSGFIKPDKIVDVKVVGGRHFVYNLSTKPGWYIANNTIVHNCNEQWQTYWSQLFYENGFGAAKVQPDIQRNQDVELWYRQNMILYERGGMRVVTDFVLPEYYLQIVSHLNHGIERR